MKLWNLFVVCNAIQRLSISNPEGVQFLSDELSEVSRNRQLIVQFLRADFAAVSDVSGKKISAEF